MNNHITHEQAKKGIQSAIERRRYNNSLEGSTRNTIQNTLAKKIGFDTLDKDRESVAQRLQENAKRVQAGEYIDPKEYDSLVADSENVGKRLAYYRNYIRNAAPENEEAIKSASDMASAFLDASKSMGEQQAFFSNFKDANDYKTQMDAYKEQQRLTFDYDLNAGKTKLDASKGTKEYDALKDEYELAKYYQDAYNYDKLSENEDFEKKSKKANSTWDIGETARAADYINGAWHAEAGQAVNKFIDGLVPFLNNDTTEAYERYKLMDESEVATFNYLYNTKGQKEAQKYLDFIDKYGLQSEYAQKNKTKNWLTNIMRAIDSGGERIINGILNVDDALLHAGADLVDWKGAENYFGDKLIDSVQPSNSQLALSARQDEAGFWEGLTYDLAANAPQQLVNIGFSIGLGKDAGSLVASIVLGVSEGTNAYAEALAGGEDNLGRRLSYALGMGAMEGVTNKLLDGTLKGSTATKLAEKLTSNISSAAVHTIVTYGAKAFSEGFEESLQEVLGTVIGNTVLDKDDEVWNWKQIGYSGLVGILSANIMNSPSAAANLRLPENSKKSYHDTFDLADVEGASFDTRFNVFKENYMKQDEAISAKVISDVTSGNTENAYKTIDEAVKGYKYAEEYSRRELHQSGNSLTDFDDQITYLNTMKKLIEDEKFNAEAAKTATMQSTSIWQIAAENNDAAAKVLLQDGLSNTQIEKTVLSNAGVAKAFKRITGVDLSKYKTVSQKRNAVKVTAEAYKAFASSEVAAQVTEILKANNSASDASVRSQNRINAQKILTEAYKAAESEDQTARKNGDRNATDVAQAKMKLISTLQNDVRNGKILSFASLDGSVAINNARKTQSAPKTESNAATTSTETKSSVASTTTVDEDLQDAFNTLSEDTRKILGKKGTKGTTISGDERILTDQDVIDLAAQDLNRRIEEAKSVISDETASKEEKAAAKALLKELKAELKKLNQFSQLSKQANIEREQQREFENEVAVKGRIETVIKFLKKFGVDLEYELGGVWYIDEDGNLMTEEEGKKALAKGKRVEKCTNNGYQSAWTVKIMSALAQGNIKVLSGNRMVTKRIGYGKGEVRPDRAVDIVIGHELVHFVKTNASNDSAKALYKDIIEALKGTIYDESFDLAHKPGEKTDKAQENWDNLKDLYVKAEMSDGKKSLTEAQAKSKVNEDYILEEIAADYMGTLFSDYGMINAINAQSNIFARLWEWLTKLSHKHSENGLDRQKRVDLLAEKLKSIVDRVYGSQEKLTKKKAEVEAKKKAYAEAEKEVREARKAEAKATRKEEAEAAQDAQKSTESDEKTEDEQTPAETEKRAENDKKMMVVGEMTETADLSALDKAKAMLEENPNADTVTETGWWLGKDNKWRYEIADNDMRFERDGLYRNPQTLEDYIEHDKLFEAYPHLRNVRVKFERVVEGDPKTNGEYDAVNNVITLKAGRSSDDTKRTLIHEIQHAVQEYEGFSNGFNTNGGYVEWFNRVFDNVKETREYKLLKTPDERWNYVENIATLPSEEAIGKTAKSLYRNNYGEIEARATAERLDMSDEQRRESPIANDGNTYSLEDIRSKFVDNLRSMGYTDSQIQEKINGGNANGRTEEIGSGNRGRNTEGKYIETDRQSTQSSRNLDTRGEGENTQNLHDGRVKYSVAGEVTEESSQDYSKMVAETEEQRSENEKLVSKFVESRGTQPETESVKEFLTNLLESYGSDTWIGKVISKYSEAIKQLYGENIDVTSATKLFRDVATEIYNGAIEDELETLVKDLHATEINVTESIKNDFGDDWNDFRKNNFGNLSLRNGRGKSVSEVYNELVKTNSELFPDDVTDPTEQLKKLAEVASGIRAEIKSRVYNEAQQNVIEQITSDLIEGTMSLDPQILYAFNEKRKTRDYYKKRIERLKKAHSEWSEKVMDQIASKNERQKLAYEKKMSYKRLKELGKALFTPTKKKHIPENMRNDIAAVFGKMKFSGRTAADIEMREYVEAGLSKLKPGENGEKSDYKSLPPALSDVLQQTNYFDLSSLDAEGMHEFSQILRQITQAVNQEDKLYHSSESASELALSAIRSLAIAKGNNAEVLKKIGNADTLLGLSAWDPEGLFNYISIPELCDLFKKLASGQDTYANTLNYLADKLAVIHGQKVDENGKITQPGKIPEEWRTVPVDIKLDNAQTITFTKAQIMSLYLLYKQADSRKRLLDSNGGIELTKKEVKRDYKKKWVRKAAAPVNKLLERLGKDKLTSTVTVLGQSATLTENDINNILSDKYFDEKMKGVADEISKLLNGEISDMLNEKSLELDGYKRFTVKDYYPMTPSDMAKNKDGVVDLMEAQYEALKIGKSFTYDRTGTSGVKLVVDDIFNVVDRHILGVSQYVGFESGLRDFMKVYTGKYNNTQLKHEIEKQMGPGATKAIDNFLMGIQGRQMNTGDEQLISERFFSNYKAAQVALNMSVVAKQPMSILRAMPEFSKAGVKAMAKMPTKADIEEMLANSGLAKEKKWGFSENTTAKTVRQLYDDNSLEWRDRMNDLPVFNWAEKMDIHTWGRIWVACRAETNSLKEATDKFNEVIRKTQVVNTATTSSPIANQSFFHKLVFAFKNEPLKTFNYTRAAVQDFVRGKEGSGKHLTKVLAMNALNTAIVAAITTAFSMMRDDEDDDLDEFWSKWYDNAKWDVLSTVTIGAGDLIEAWDAAENNRTVERADLAVLTDVIQLANRISSGKYESSGKSWVQMMYDASNVASSITGIPIKSVLRMLKTTGNNVVSMIDDPYSDYLWEKVFYNVDSSASQKRFAEILTEALDKDYGIYAKIKSDLVKHGYGQSRIDSAVKSSDRFVKAWNKGYDVFKAEMETAQKHDDMLTANYVMPMIESRYRSLITELFNAMLDGEGVSEAKKELLAFVNPSTKKATTEKQVETFIKDKLESAIKKDVKDILVSGYGTPQYEANVEGLLQKYRNFEDVDEKYIDKVAKSINKNK